MLIGVQLIDHGPNRSQRFGQPTDLRWTSLGFHPIFLPGHVEIHSYFKSMQRFPFLCINFHVAVCALAAALAVCPAKAQVGLGLSPMHVDLDLAPGDSYTDSLTLSSQSDELVHVRAEILDFLIDDDENPQFGAFPEVASNSCRTFLRVSSRDVDVSKKLDQQIRFTFNPPATIKAGSYHCAVGFTSQPAPNAKKSGLSISVRVVASFYISIGKPSYISEVSALSLQTDPASKTKSLRAFCVLKNNGNYTFRPIGGLDLMTPDGTVRTHVPLRSLPVFPQRGQRFLLPLSVTPKEGERLRLRINIGNGEVEEASAIVSSQMLAH